VLKYYICLYESYRFLLIFFHQFGKRKQELISEINQLKINHQLKKYDCNKKTIKLNDSTRHPFNEFLLSMKVQAAFGIKMSV